jgi:hypothetical protein
MYLVIVLLFNFNSEQIKIQDRAVKPFKKDLSFVDDMMLSIINTVESYVRKSENNPKQRTPQQKVC